MTKRDLNWLGSCSLSTSKNPSLKAMKFLMSRLGHPEKKTKFVHVAGTNGKGSVVEMMAKILEKAGYKTGKFMSPHLVRFNERIQVNGREITDAEIEKLLAELQPVIDEYEAEFGVEITLFEIETTMALVYYAEMGCDVVVLEVGLGGEFDCTNIVTPEVAVIVSIGYDHMNILGESLVEIAGQKAGIVKPGGKVVSGELPEEARGVVRRKCEEMRAELIEAVGAEYEIIEGGVRVSDTEFREIEVPLRGEKQAENAAICLECVRILRENGWEISERAVREGLSEVVHKGRFETVCRDPLVVYDGAHNLPAIENFWKNVEAYYPDVPDERKTFVLALRKKDCRRILQVLLRERAEHVFTTGEDTESYTLAEELLEMAREICPNGRYRVMDLTEALQGIKQEKREGVTFVVGTFFVYSEVEKVFGEGNE